MPAPLGLFLGLPFIWLFGGGCFWSPGKVDQGACALGGWGPCPLLILSFWSQPPFLLWPWRADVRRAHLGEAALASRLPGSDAARARAPLLRGAQLAPPHLLSIASGSSCLFGGLYAGLSAPQKNRPVVSSRAEAVVLSHPSARGFPSRRYKHGFALVSSAHRALPWSLYSICLLTNCPCSRY